MKTSQPDVAQKSIGALALSAIGVVYGDIGTSPLYALKECFIGEHRMALDREHVFGVLSLIFWSVMLVVSLKYVTFMMRADNRGEGGSLALLALVTRITRGSRLSFLAAILGIFAASLFYGDSMITPAISVLSAVEGLQVVAPALHDYIVPLTLLILIVLFVIQRRGTAAVGLFFGPVMFLWFLTLGTLGALHIARDPTVLQAMNPYYALQFFMAEPLVAFLGLGSVVLALTGAEALYTDMGHFGKKPIRLAWFTFVLPALLLNYFGQGAMLLNNPSAIESPFFLMAPEWALWPMLILATAAAVIASQAVISGAFSLSQQAVQLRYLPRMAIVHTSAKKVGQIYVPFINWTLLVFVCALVLGFQSSSNLASAYGVAVTGTMMIDTILLTFVMFYMWRWSRWITIPLALLFITIDVAFFMANAVKIPHGGWFPLVIGLMAFIMLTTWKRGRALLISHLYKDAMPIELFINSCGESVARVPGTAVFMSSGHGSVPPALLHNLKHNKVLHQRVVMLTVITTDAPHVPADQRIELAQYRHGFYWITVRYGFMEVPNIPLILQQCAQLGLTFDLMDTSFFLTRETLIPSAVPGMAPWRERLFSIMSRMASTPMEFFKLPANRVVELGSQVEI